MIAETLVFAALLLVFAVPLAVAFGPDDLAVLRRWRLRWRERRYAAYCYRHGVGLEFWIAQLREPRPRRRLAGGGR